MKKLLCLLVSLCFVLPVSAGVNVKAGYIGYTRDTIDTAPYIELSYDNNNLEVGVGYYETEISGYRSFYWHWREVCRVGFNAGTIKSIPIYVAYKFKFDKFALGVGGGYQFLSFDEDYRTQSSYVWYNENYDGKPKVDNEAFLRLSASYDIKPNVAFEVIGQLCDLDIESGIHNVGIAEDDSNLNMIIGALVFKF